MKVSHFLTLHLVHTQRVKSKILLTTLVIDLVEMEHGMANYILLVNHMRQYDDIFVSDKEVDLTSMKSVFWMLTTVEMEYWMALKNVMMEIRKTTMDVVVVVSLNLL